MSLTFSREAWRHLAASFLRVLEDPNDLEGRTGMQLGACLAGMAIENSMLGAAHALANPLTASYGIVHGEAVGIMLPHVIRFNGEVFSDWYCELLSATGGEENLPNPASGVEGLAGFVASLVEESGLARRLADCGVEQTRLPQLAEDAAKQWTGTFNPREVGPTELLALYRAAY